jgi:hypothetical protein
LLFHFFFFFHASLTSWQSTLFQEDIFPPTKVDGASLTADQFLAGQVAVPKKFSLKVSNSCLRGWLGVFDDGASMGVVVTSHHSFSFQDGYVPPARTEMAAVDQPVAGEDIERPPEGEKAVRWRTLVPFDGFFLSFGILALSLFWCSPCAVPAHGPAAVEGVALAARGDQAAQAAARHGGDQDPPAQLLVACFSLDGCLLFSYPSRSLPLGSVYLSVWSSLSFES